VSEGRPSRGFLVDTDVLVDYLRGLEAAADWLESADAELFVSAITVAELFAGVRNKAEQDILADFLKAFTIVPVDISIARAGGLLKRDYARSHGTGLADAMIAATAQELGSVLVTLNRKHFPMVGEVLVPYMKK